MGSLFSSELSIDELEERLMMEEIECKTQIELYGRNNPEYARECANLLAQNSALLARIRLTTRQDQHVEHLRRADELMDKKVKIDVDFMNKAEESAKQAIIKDNMVSNLPTSWGTQPVQQKKYKRLTRDVN